LQVARKKTTKDEAWNWATTIARLAHDRHGEDILVLDLRDCSPVTDYFVIATGTSGRQMSGVADEIEAIGAKIGQRVWRVAGRETGDWIVMDFVDVVVHLFNQDLRKYYDLELIWGEAPRVEWKTKEHHSERDVHKNRKE
jgi:ribosome-associated protein